MASLRGWDSVGQRLDAKVPYEQWKTMTFLASFRCDCIVLSSAMPYHLLNRADYRRRIAAARAH